MEVPGCGRGYIGPGGRADNGSQWKCTGGAAGYLDQIILSTNHIYPHPTCKSTYDTGSFDPEGILGTLNTIVICFLGVQAGRILVYHQRHISRLLRFVVWGVIFVSVINVCMDCAWRSCVLTVGYWWNYTM
jgi:heparan-alpha-glucosaminide N-acetyltransferase